MPSENKSKYVSSRPRYTKEQKIGAILFVVFLPVFVCGTVSLLSCVAMLLPPVKEFFEPHIIHHSLWKVCCQDQWAHAILFCYLRWMVFIPVTVVLLAGLEILHIYGKKKKE